MPQKLKYRLGSVVLQDYVDKFYFFFNDVKQDIYAEESFIFKVLSNMDCQIFSGGKEVIEPGTSFDYIYLIFKN
jgi:hypothetical protein